MTPVTKDLTSRSSQLYLAPMDGVTDWIMRETLTRLGGIDHCVTEFLRITKNLHPHKVFLRHCPELLTQSRTSSGTPVYLQLLGGDPQPMAENAARAAELGSAGLDLNFGCPAKVVNRHDGGAVLLKCPDRLFRIASEVRRAVPKGVPVAAKMRLGYEDPSLCLENAQALEAGGAQWLTVHCRTKVQGYRPPAHWEWISRIQEMIKIPVIANGDIDSLAQFQRCQEMTGAHHFMIGRAALSRPFLFRQIKEQNEIFSSKEEEWLQISRQILPFWNHCAQSVSPYFATARTKQWLKHLAIEFSEAKNLFSQVKVYHSPSEFVQSLQVVLNGREIEGEWAEGLADETK